jgi:hypothetical protein
VAPPVLYQVAAQGRFVAWGARTCFRMPVALAIAEDLRRRGYADAHAQRWVPEAPLGPMALTLVAAAGRRAA